MWHRSDLLENSIYLKDHGTVIFLSIVLIITTALYFLRDRSGRKLPPGPVGLPIFGYYLFIRKNPVKKLHELTKKYGNVFGLYLGSQYVVVLSDWESMKDALSQSSIRDRPPSLFAAVPFKFGLAGANGQEWIEKRRLCSRAVKDSGLNRAGFEELVHEEALELAHRIAKEGEKPVEVREFFSESFVNSVVTLILGERLYVGHPTTKIITKAVDAILQYTPTIRMINFSPILSKLLHLLGIEEEFPLAEELSAFGKFVSDTVDERIQKPSLEAEDSFLDRYQEAIQNHKNDKSSYITVNSMKGDVTALLTGAGETTRTTLVWTLIAMADYPDIQRKVHEELDTVIGKNGSIRWKDRFKVPYTFATLLESMRWVPIEPLIAFRIVTEDTKIRGYHIPRGTFITINNWSIHQDPKYWKNPEEFVPERFLLEDGKKVNTSPEGFNSFSYGKRSCPGRLTAEMTSLIFFSTLMQKYKVVSKDGKKVKYDMIKGLTYQAANVELRFIPR